MKLLSYDGLEILVNKIKALIDASSHTHDNKSVLDNTTASFTTTLETKLSGIGNASTSAKGLVQLSTSTSSTSTSYAATPSAVKSAYDLANTAKTAAANAKDNSITGLSVSGRTITYTKGSGTTGTITTQDNDTKNTAGSTNTSSKIFLVGATSQAANPQTYSHDTAYVGTDGCLYSNSTKVSVEGHTHVAITNDDIDTICGSTDPGNVSGEPVINVAHDGAGNVTIAFV